ncbi:MAG: hypothetical protein QXK63_00600 [Thermoproteus sp.]
MLFLVYSAGKKPSPPQGTCAINATVVCGAPKNVTGVVYSQCEYNGEVKIKTDLGIDWSNAWPWRCVAAGTAGGRLYAVFERQFVVGFFQAEHGPFKNVGYCYCKRFNINPCIIQEPAIAVLMRAYLVVDVNSGRGFLFFPSEWREPEVLFVFAEDGVYVSGSTAYREVAGEPLANCAYVVEVEVDPSKLKVGVPLQNVTGTYIKLG